MGWLFSFSNELIELCIKSSFIGKEDEKDNDPIYYQKMKNRGQRLEVPLH